MGALATEQHGAVARAQLRALGLSDKNIDYRLAAGRLIRLYPGVFAVGHAKLAREGRWMAAVLGCGERAVLSHTDAAAHWELMPTRGTLMHVTTSRRSGRVPDPRRVLLHRVGTLTADETTRHDAIPITTPARTLLDVAAFLRPRTVEDLIAQADRLGLFDLVAVRRVLTAHPRQHGAPSLRQTLDRITGTGVAQTRSALEIAMLQLCDDFDLQPPLTNVALAGFIVDFHWPGTNLVVETDGYAYHSMPSAFEADRERDQILTLAGYRVARFTYDQVRRRRRQTARRLWALLKGSGSIQPR